MARALPVEGEAAGYPAVIHATDAQVPTCDLDTPVAALAPVLDEPGFCIVTDGDGTVLGRVRAGSAEGRPEAAAAEVMEEGPSTFRPDVPLVELIERMRSAGVSSVIVTDPDGRLIGTLDLERAQRRLQELHSAHARH